MGIFNEPLTWTLRRATIPTNLSLPDATTNANSKGMDSKSNVAWDDTLGAKTPSIVKTNANGELFFYKVLFGKKIKNY